jgi:hypothetical protein
MVVRRWSYIGCEGVPAFVRTVARAVRVLGRPASRGDARHDRRSLVARG